MAVRTAALALLACLAGCAGRAPHAATGAATGARPAQAGFRPAPMPGDATPPAGRDGVQFEPAVLRSVTVPRGSGYLPGSTYRNREDLPSTRGLGAALSVPFNLL